MKGLAAAMVAVLLAAQPAMAQNKAKPAPRWAKEPDSVMGLKLGERLPDGHLRPCGGVQNYEGPAALGFCSLDENRRSKISVSGFSVSVFDTGLLSLEDGIAESLYVTAKHKDYSNLKAILIERYGQPTSQASSTVRTKAGASFPSESLTWRGTKITIELDERAARVDQSSVFFSTNNAIAQSEREGEAATKSNAGKL